MESPINNTAVASGLLERVVPFYPLSYRTPEHMSGHIEASINLSALDKSNAALIEGYRQVAKSLLIGWQADSTAAEDPQKWHNLILSASRDFTSLISIHSNHAAESADAFCLTISQLILCMEYEATNYRPQKYNPEQNWLEWKEACEREKELAVTDVLYGSAPPNQTGEIMLIHRRRLKAIATLYQFAREQYEKYLPKHFARRAQLLPAYYTAPPIAVSASLPTPISADVPPDHVPHAAMVAGVVNTQPVQQNIDPRQDILLDMYLVSAYIKTTPQSDWTVNIGGKKSKPTLDDLAALVEFYPNTSPITYKVCTYKPARVSALVDGLEKYELISAAGPDALIGGIGARYGQKLKKSRRPEHDNNKTYQRFLGLIETCLEKWQKAKLIP